MSTNGTGVAARAALAAAAAAGAVVASGALAACRAREVPADAAPIAPEVTLAAADVQPVEYVDFAGRLRTARGVASVPERSRHAVAIEGPDGPGGSVWIADASRPAAAWPAVRGSRLTLERLGLAGLPPGEASRVALPAPVAPVGRPAIPPPSDGVTIYGTTWCGACADARAWFDARGVTYTFRNVEAGDADPTAALDAVRTATAVGAPADRVPVIDVAGKVIVGFDPVRLTSILGEPI